MISIREIKTKISSPYSSMRDLVVKATDGNDAFNDSGLLPGKNPYWNIFSKQSPGLWSESGRTLKFTLPSYTKLSDWVSYNHNANAPYANFDKTITLNSSGNGNMAFEIDFEEFDYTGYTALFVEFTLKNWFVVRSAKVPIAKFCYPTVSLTNVPDNVTSGIVNIYLVRDDINILIPFDTFNGVVSIQRLLSVKPKAYYIFEADEYVQNAWVTQPINEIVEYNIGITTLGQVSFSYEMGMGAEVTFCLYRNYSLENSWYLGPRDPGTTYSDGVYIMLSSATEANDIFTVALIANY